MVNMSCQYEELDVHFLVSSHLEDARNKTEKEYFAVQSRITEGFHAFASLTL